MTPDQVYEASVESIRYARTFTDDVEFSAEDASRSDPDFLCRVIEGTIAAGATTINVPDTTGYATPDEYAELLRSLMERIPNSDRVVWSVHCHDDLGLAVANSLAAVRIGARQVECTVNGIGERAGNASLEEIVMALHTRRNYVRDAHRARHDEDLSDQSADQRDHGHLGPAEQGDRRRQRVRARGRDPSARRADEPRDVRDHDAGDDRHPEQHAGDGKAFGAARAEEAPRG